MRPGLNAAAQDGGNAGAGRGERAGGGGRGGGRAHLGYQAAVEHRERGSVVPVEQENDGLVGREARGSIVVKECDHLDGHRFAHRRHGGDDRIAARNRNHLPDRLDHAAGGKRDQRAFRAVDQGRPFQKPCDLRFPR